MKKLVVLFFLMISATMVGFAQKLPTAEELSKKNVEELEKRLTLSSTQKSVITKYAYDLAKSQIELMKKQQAQGYNDEEMTRYYKTMHDTNDKIKAVLKPEQVLEYNKIIEERLSGVDPNKKKKNKKNQEEEKVVGIEGLKKVNNP